MKIKLMSDLHLEFLNPGKAVPDFMLEHENVDVLVLAGDITVGARDLRRVLEVFAKHYPYVVYLPGNHEFYGKDIDSLVLLHEVLPSNVHFLNPGKMQIQDVTFIGAPLWTNFRGGDPWAMKNAKDRISDFRLIRGFTPQLAAALYESQLGYIKYHYENTPGKKVIVTHFLPAIECIDPIYANENLLNYYFANDLSSWISNLSDTTWMFGHTHSSVDITLGDTRLICNPYGYHPHDINKNFNKQLYVDI